MLSYKSKNLSISCNKLFISISVDSKTSLSQIFQWLWTSEKTTKYTEMQMNCSITNYIASLIKYTLIFDIGLSIIPITGTYTNTFHPTTNPLTKTNLDQTCYSLWILSSIYLYLLCVIHCRHLADYRQTWGISHNFKRTVRSTKKPGYASQLAHCHSKWKIPLKITYHSTNFFWTEEWKSGLTLSSSDR